MPATHHLKTWPAFFDAVERGDKTFEVRKNDRAFQAGDTLMLEFYDPASPPGPLHQNHRPTLCRRVTFVLPGGEFGIEPGYVVMGLAEVEQQ